jgi:hypothetical protein
MYAILKPHKNLSFISFTAIFEADMIMKIKDNGMQK